MRGPQFLKLLGTLLSSDSAQKMEGDLAYLVEMYHHTKKSGRSATLILSSKRGAATIAIPEIKLDDATPSLSMSSTQSSTPAAPAPGKQRRRRRSSSQRAKANVRAAQHQAAQAKPKGKPPASGGAHSPPPPPSPPATPRLVTAVGRTTSPRPSFSEVDGAQETSMEWLEFDERLSVVIAEVSGVCDTCDDHHLEVTEDCYFLCQGKSDCFEMIRPIWLITIILVINMIENTSFC